MSNIGSYDERVKNFDWSIAERELGYKAGEVDQYRLVLLGPHLRDGQEGTSRRCSGKARQAKRERYTYNDIRVCSNAIGAFLRGLGLKDEDRVCLFMDRIPELYIGLLGILKIGPIAQPLFSAFGDESLFVRLENAGTSAIITQRKHASKVRKILDQLPNLKHIIIVDHDGNKELKEREVAFSMEADTAEELEHLPDESRVPFRAALHLGNNRPAQGRTARSLFAHLPVPDGQMGAGYHAMTTSTGAPPIQAGSPGPLTASSAPWALGVTQCVLDSGFSAEAWYRFIEKVQSHGLVFSADRDPLVDEGRR